jgi:hypothetical protein
MSTIHITTSRAERIAAWADRIDAEGREIYSWGSDGWDTPERPYVRFFVSADSGAVRIGHYVEGDFSRFTFRDDEHGGRVGAATAAADMLDTLIGWTWSRGYGTPKGYDASNPAEHHTGPYVG